MFRKKKRKGNERNVDQLLSICAPTRAQIHNLGICPDQESNPQLFGLWDDAPTNQTTRPELIQHLLNSNSIDGLMLDNLL